MLHLLNFLQDGYRKDRSAFCLKYGSEATALSVLVCRKASEIMCDVGHTLSSDRWVQMQRGPAVRHDKLYTTVVSLVGKAAAE